MDEAIENVMALTDIPEFQTMISDTACKETADQLDVMQMNIGNLCNLACKHCHVEAGPNQTKLMSRKVMEACLSVCREQQIETIDITGGAPEMNPDFTWLVAQAAATVPHVIVRTNLVILNEEPYQELPAFFKNYQVEVVGSLPYYQAAEMDRVRGAGTFDSAIRAIQRLNQLGYGKDPDLVLNLVYNPAGAFFPPPQEAMEKMYKERLYTDYGIVFNQLYTITNNPIGRFGQFLKRSGNLESYMKDLYHSFNEATIPGMMCRYQVSVGYDGKLYDCDFNQAVDLPVLSKETIFDWVGKPYQKRPICFDKHCYACTAGAGSSCGGTTE